MKQWSYLVGILLAASSFTVFAAETTPVSAPAKPTLVMPQSMIIAPGPIIQNSRQQLEFELQSQELHLEQQILQIKEELLRLKQIDAMQIGNNPSSNIDLHWISETNGKMPENSVIAAEANGKPLYICHANYLGGIHPGQLVEKGCLISYGGHAITQINYQVLSGKQKINWKPSGSLFRWNSPILPMMPGPMYIMHTPNFQSAGMPVVGGIENNRSLYICRAIFDNQIHLGKVVAMGCNISAQEVEVRVPTFEVLFA